MGGGDCLISPPVSLVRGNESSGPNFPIELLAQLFFTSTALCSAYHPQWQFAPGRIDCRNDSHASLRVRVKMAGDGLCPAVRNSHHSMSKNFPTRLIDVNNTISGILLEHNVHIRQKLREHLVIRFRPPSNMRAPK
jgi:hypothetical protein